MIPTTYDASAAAAAVLTAIAATVISGLEPKCPALLSSSSLG